MDSDSGRIVSFFVCLCFAFDPRMSHFGCVKLLYSRDEKIAQSLLSARAQTKIEESANSADAELGKQPPINCLRNHRSRCDWLMSIGVLSLWDVHWPGVDCLQFTVLSLQC